MAKSCVRFELLVERPLLAKIQVGNFWSIDFKNSSKSYLKASNLFFISVSHQNSFVQGVKLGRNGDSIELLIY